MSADMDLVKNNREEKYNWNVRETSNIRNKLPRTTKTSALDYKSLQWLCNIKGLKSRDSCSPSTAEAHEIFMQNYKKMFLRQPDKTELTNSENRPSLETSLRIQAGSISMSSHEATRKASKPWKTKEHLPLLYKERRNMEPGQMKAKSISTLRHFLRKRPFERNSGDNEKIFSALRSFDLFRDCVDETVLRDLCSVAQLEVWKDSNFSVYGKTGIHLILKGSVVPLFEPHLVMAMDGSTIPQRFVPLADDASKHSISVGNCFGTWLPYSEPYTKELSVVTAEPNCEFMKICSSDYKRVLAQINQREQTEKMNLLTSCDQYRTWPRQPLTALANSLEWVSYPPSTVLASENCKPPFVGFILSGECHVLKQLQVLHPGKSDKRIQRTKQVVMGRLKQFDSFAEISLLLDEPITCTIVTATEVKLGVVRPEKLHNLDEVTKQLIIQSSQRTYGNLTKEEIQNEYIQQEVKKKWNEFKHAQVLDVINTYGIQPGYGKWKN